MTNDRQLYFAWHQRQYQTAAALDALYRMGGESWRPLLFRHLVLPTRSIRRLCHQLRHTVDVFNR